MDYIPNKDSVRSLGLGLDDFVFHDSGGFKAVYRGTIGGKQEAVKIIYIPPTASPTASADGPNQRDEIESRVRREIDILRRCTTDRLVKLGAITLKEVVMSGHDYLIYSEEFVPGNSLKSVIARGYQPDYSELRQLASCLVDVLTDLQNIDDGHIHRDIKPGNIIKTEDIARPFVVLDLGIAFKIHGTELTMQQGGPPGTRRYMAPELFRPNYKDYLDVRSDIYSVGVTLFEYATRQHPLAKPGEDVFHTMYRIFNESPAPLETLRADLPREFCALVDRCIKKWPALRFRNVGKMKEALEGLS